MNQEMPDEFPWGSEWKFY